MPKKQTKNPTQEVVQMNVEGIIMVTDGQGKASGLFKHGATIMQANFNITLADLSVKILASFQEQVKATQSDQEVAAAAGKMAANPQAEMR